MHIYRLKLDPLRSLVLLCRCKRHNKKRKRKGMNVLLSSCIISYINLQVASQVSGINLAFRFLFCSQFTVLTP